LATGLYYNGILVGCFQIRLRFTRLWRADYNRTDSTLFTKMLRLADVVVKKTSE